LWKSGGRFSLASCKGSNGCNCQIAVIWAGLKMIYNKNFRRPHLNEVTSFLVPLIVFLGRSTDRNRTCPNRLPVKQSGHLSKARYLGVLPTRGWAVEGQRGCPAHVIPPGGGAVGLAGGGPSTPRNQHTVHWFWLKGYALSMDWDQITGYRFPSWT